MEGLAKGTELAKRYTLVRRLGSGGAAETWLAADRMTGADVALKILASEALGPADLRKEWQTGIRLMHAHIVRVFEFHDPGEDKGENKGENKGDGHGGRPFYSLQFIDGPDIGALAGAPPEHSLPALALVADALRYAHGKGVVHRDIKAANVLIDRNGAPYLIDFGTAAIGGGSLISASPQSLAGEEPAPADDIFALGGLIYELVAGRSPYSGTATAEDIAKRTPPPLEAADGSAVPEALQTLVAAMLDKDPAERPDAEAVVGGLRAMGYAGAPAPRSYVRRDREAAAEVIEVGGTEARRRPGTTAAVPADEGGGGLSPRLVFGALAVLVLLLLGVVFVLPERVPTEPAIATDDAATPGEDGAAPAAQATESPGRGVGFTENRESLEGRDERVVKRAETEAVLGELLTKLDLLDKRAVQRWGGLRYKQAQAVYAEGDEAYLARNYALAIDRYREAISMLEPLIDEVDRVFEKTHADARAALEAADAPEALRLFELAVAISPGNAAAQEGYERARNLQTVLDLVDQGLAYEKDLELELARRSFARAVELDPAWEPAREGLARIRETIRDFEFESRMSEGLMALGEQDYRAARAAFLAAQKLKPSSPEPADGLLQVDQGLRLDRIAALEAEAAEQAGNEQWEAAVETYEAALEIDDSLVFAQQGLVRAQQMAALHDRLEEYIAEPDSLSAPATMRAATKLVVDITRMAEIGPRLSDQRDELSRLLKRAATPLTVELVSDNATDVSVYKVGKLGSFTTRELSLRPGTYVAVGSRPGYRDVRVEFRVAPEIDLGPVVVRCEEVI